MEQAGPHIPQELQEGVHVIAETKYGTLRGGRTANGAAVFLEVPYALPPARFTDPHPLPADYRYEDKDYIYETKYCYQPQANIVGLAAGINLVERLKGLGKPSENPLFVNIVSPPPFTSDSKYPVTVYIHGGFLQIGSPHEYSSQAQYAAAERRQVFVNIGYRLSAFGFLACDEPQLDGNFGFKDQWLALLWIQENIAAFGGNPENIRLTGLSAGAHSIHQILHHISYLPDGQMSPIQTAVLQSNAMLTAPKTPAELQPQFEALCRALDLDPTAPDILDTLRDPTRVPAETLMHVIGTGKAGVEYSSYRGCLDGIWMSNDPDPMSWQRTGDLARKLREKGVKAIAIGDLPDEWYVYSMGQVNGPKDVFPNILQYYPRTIVEKLMSLYETLPESATAEEARKLMGTILSNGQVHVPVRLFARDFQQAGFPMFRYEIHWVPEQARCCGLVTHGSDRCLWALRLPCMTPHEQKVALAWLDAFDEEFDILAREGKQVRALNQALTLQEDQTIAWTEDKKWDRLMEFAKVLLGENTVDSA